MKTARPLLSYMTETNEYLYYEITVYWYDKKYLQMIALFVKIF